MATGAAYTVISIGLDNEHTARTVPDAICADGAVATLTALDRYRYARHIVVSTDTSDTVLIYTYNSQGQCLKRLALRGDLRASERST